MENVNEKQRKVLIAASAVFVIMLLFPPYTAIFKGVTVNGGYAFILMGPSGQYSDMFIVDTALLFLQWLFVVVISTIAWFLLKKKV